MAKTGQDSRQDSQDEGAQSTVLKAPKRRSKKTPWRYPPRPTPRAKPGRCHRCHREVITCQWDGWPIHFDPQPLTLLGEVEALVFGLRTWFIVDGNVSKRNTWAIKTSPNGLGGAVVRDHTCERVQPTGASVKFINPTDSDDPPF